MPITGVIVLLLLLLVHITCLFLFLFFLSRRLLLGAPYIPSVCRRLVHAEAACGAKNERHSRHVDVILFRPLYIYIYTGSSFAAAPAAPIYPLYIFDTAHHDDDDAPCIIYIFGGEILYYQMRDDGVVLKYFGFPIYFE